MSSGFGKTLAACGFATVAAVAALAPARADPAATAPASGDRVLEDFESYEPGEVIGAGAKSTPWRRFGEATTDNVVATGRDDRVIAGALSGQYSVAWPARFGMVRRALAEPLDLSEAARLTVKLRSAAEGETHTRVQLSLSDGRAAFETRQTVELSAGDAAREVAFDLAPGKIERVDGDRSVTAPALLAGVTEVGLKFTSPGGRTYKETILIDDLTVRGAGSP